MVFGPNTGRTAALAHLEGVGCDSPWYRCPKAHTAAGVRVQRRLVALVPGPDAGIKKPGPKKPAVSARRQQQPLVPMPGARSHVDGTFPHCRLDAGREVALHQGLSTPSVGSATNSLPPLSPPELPTAIWHLPPNHVSHLPPHCTTMMARAKISSGSPHV